MHFRHSVTHTELGSYFLFLQEQIKDNIITSLLPTYTTPKTRACVPCRILKILLSPALKKPAANSSSQTLTLDPAPFPIQCSEPKNETTASPIPLGSNPRSTTDGTSSSAPQSEHMLARWTTPTYFSLHVHKHITESDLTPPKPTYSDYPIT